MRTIYVDGSCLLNQNVNSKTPASWSVVVVDGDSKIGRGTGEIIHEFSGMVDTDPNSKKFLGAEVGSNNTGELTAIAEALRWVLANPEVDKILIRTDSTYAGNLSSGTWRAKTNIALVKNVQSLWKEVQNICGIEWEHIRAHNRHRWNERADHLAFRRVNGKKPESLAFWKVGQR